MHKSNGSPRLYVHRFSSGRLCNDTNVANYTPFHTNLNQAWEPRALQMVRDVLTEVSDPSLADWFLVDVCLARFYLSMRDSVNPATQARVASYNAHRGKHTQKVGHKDCKACDRLEESLVAEMGHPWVQRPHRHIVSHFRCPRVGRATYPYVPFGRSGLWPSTARGATYILPEVGSLCTYILIHIAASTSSRPSATPGPNYISISPSHHSTIDSPLCHTCATRSPLAYLSHTSAASIYGRHPMDTARGEGWLCSASTTRPCCGVGRGVGAGAFR